MRPPKASVVLVMVMLVTRASATRAATSHAPKAATATAVPLRLASIDMVDSFWTFSAGAFCLGGAD